MAYPYGSGSNQYGAFPTFNYMPPPGGQYPRPIGTPKPPTSGPGGTPSTASGVGTVPTSSPYGGYPGFGSSPYPPFLNNLQGKAGDVGASNKLPGGANTVMAADPLFTQALYSWLGGQIGSGMPAFDLSAYLPSSGGATGPGQVSAPLNQTLAQLQSFLTGGSGGTPSQAMMEQLMQSGGMTGVLGNILQTGGQTGPLGYIGGTGGLGFNTPLGNLYRSGGITGPLQSLYQTGGLQGPLGNLYQTGGLQGTLGNLYQTGGLTGNLGAAAGTPGGLGGSPVLQQLAQSGGLTGVMGSMAASGDPISQTPAWQAMIQAENQNIKTGEADLKEQFASMGDLSSSASADAMSQYLQQTVLGQNAQLTQAQAQALEAAANRQLTAGQTGIGTQLAAGTTGYQGGLGAGEFGAGLQSSLGEFGVGTQSQLGQFGAGLQSQLGQFGDTLKAQLGQGGIQAQLASLLPSLQAQQNVGLAGLGTQTQTAGELFGAGGSLGQYLQGLDQQSIQNLMQEYFATLPANNPLNQQIYGLATNYPPVYTPKGGGAAGLIGSLGGLLSGGASAGSLLSGLFGGGAAAGGAAGAAGDAALALGFI